MLIGREEERRQLRAAVRARKSLLIWGPADAGKTALIRAVLGKLSERERRSCIYWIGVANGRELFSHFVGRLYQAGDSLVRGKVGAEGMTETNLKRWLKKQSSLRLRGILFTALTHGDYRLFLDHFLPATRRTVQWMKEIMYRCKTPLYVCARGYSQREIGCAWSLYWNQNTRLHLAPLQEHNARELLETCIRRFALASLDLEDFREEILHLSGRLPGAIVKMCQLAADARYHYGEHIKTKLVHVDYLMQSNPRAILRPTNLQP